MTGVEIFDYGAGNIFSLKNSLEREGAEVDIITDLGDRDRHKGLLLPGVGNFDPAMRAVGRTSQHESSDLAGGAPVLGICLGMEMFFARSAEGQEAGLGMMDGEVVMLPESMKIPHMGWNSLRIKGASRLLDDIKDGSWVYFVHSYMARPAPAAYASLVRAECDYGTPVPAVVERDNLFGTQFHPEKSGPVGRQMIKNFLEICRR